MKLSRINSWLLIMIIVINGLTIGLPFVPALLFKVQAHSGLEKQQLAQKLAAAPANTANSLIMPTALFDEKVFDGPDARTLQQGVWHRPYSSTPDKGGNTVFAGHRFTYTNPRGTFYHLDKLRTGDRLGVIWNNVTYRYRVQEVKVVGPNDVAIEAPTAQARLTLYTCTPLAFPKDRLVVIARAEPNNE